jgi:hypothetical protein
MSGRFYCRALPRAHALLRARRFCADPLALSPLSLPSKRRARFGLPSDRLSASRRARVPLYCLDGEPLWILQGTAFA